MFNHLPIKKFFYQDQSHPINLKELTIIFLGVFFISFGIFAMVFGATQGQPSEALWICYVSMIIMGVGALRKNSFLIASQVNLLLVPLLFWNIDFLFYFISQESFWGITNYFFKELHPAARLISFEHFFIIPFGLWLLYLIKLNRKDAWKLSVITLFIVIMTSLAFSPKLENVNCVFYSCSSLVPDPYWQFIYPVFLIVMSIISGSIINKISIFWPNKDK